MPAESASSFNQPNRIDAWIFEPGEKRLELTEDPKIPNAATIVLRKQDHTMGNMIRSQLLLDPNVLFAGYRVPHPLETNVEIKIQTDEKSNPADALHKAFQALIRQIGVIRGQFDQQARNIELGLGPDASMGVGIGVGVQGAVGGFDPYGDGVGRDGVGAPAGHADVYDF